MEIKNIIIASAVVAIVGLIIAILLSVAEKIFHVEVDEKEIKIRQALAGNNCGACGYAGCDALAKAIAKGEAPVNACPPAGKSGADKIAEIMGTQAGDYVRQTAFVKCSGTCEVRHQNIIITELELALQLPLRPAAVKEVANTVVWVMALVQMFVIIRLSELLTEKQLLIKNFALLAVNALKLAR